MTMDEAGDRVVHMAFLEALARQLEKIGLQFTERHGGVSYHFPVIYGDTWQRDYDGYAHSRGEAAMMVLQSLAQDARAAQEDQEDIALLQRLARQRAAELEKGQ